MWKKDEVSDQAPEPRPEAKPRPERPATGAAELATIGRSISIKGEVTGDEDLLIQGRVDGSVDLKDHSVTVGPEGQVKADIIGRVVTVEGRVDGNINAGEQAILLSSAVVHGDLKAPRVVLEDGARFRGGVDMGEGSRGGGAAGGGSHAQAKKEPDFRMARAETGGRSAERAEREEKAAKAEKEKERSAAEAGE